MIRKDTRISTYLDNEFLNTERSEQESLIQKQKNTLKIMNNEEVLKKLYRIPNGTTIKITIKNQMLVLSDDLKISNLKI